MGAAFASPTSVSAAPVPMVAFQKLRRSIPPESMMNSSGSWCDRGQTAAAIPDVLHSIIWSRAVCAKRFVVWIRQRQVPLLKTTYQVAVIGFVNASDRSRLALANPARLSWNMGVKMMGHLELENRSLVIVGGTTGLGLSAAKACVRAGASVVVAADEIRSRRLLRNKCSVRMPRSS